MSHCDRCGAKCKPWEVLCSYCYEYFMARDEAEERERMEATDAEETVQD